MNSITNEEARVVLNKLERLSQEVSGAFNKAKADPLNLNATMEIIAKVATQVELISEILRREIKFGLKND